LRGREPWKYVRVLAQTIQRKEKKRNGEEKTAFRECATLGEGGVYPEDKEEVETTRFAVFTFFPIYSTWGEWKQEKKRVYHCQKKQNLQLLGGVNLAKEFCAEREGSNGFCYTTKLKIRVT